MDEKIPKTPLPGVPAGSEAAPVVGTPLSKSGLEQLAYWPAAEKPPEKKPFGGNVGKKSRADGLLAGSPAAIEADRRRDAERQRDKRARERAAAPPALPSRAAGVADSGAPPGGAEAVDLSLASMAASAPVLACSPGDIRELTDELIQATEDSRVERRRAQCREANLPENVTTRVVADSKYSVPAKKALSLSSPGLAAKWLNKSGVSSANKEELMFGTALLLIWRHNKKQDEAFQKFLDEQTPKKPDAAAPEKK